jgi:hypothetical protein
MVLTSVGALQAGQAAAGRGGPARPACGSRWRRSYAAETGCFASAAAAFRAATLAASFAAFVSRFSA